MGYDPYRPMSRALAPLTIAAAAAVMAGLTWGTWPDAMFDYGTHLYVPWRITAGQRLYADVAYFYGPLSSYADAGLFRLFGVGLWTLVWADLAVLAGVLAVVQRLAGTAAALVVVGVFAFGRYVGIGNYNWACAYCPEVTHGVALGLAAVAAMAAHAKGGRRRWLAVAGVAVGLCLLTKPEVSAAAVVAVAVGVALGAPAVRPVVRLAWVTVPAAAVLVVAFALLATQGGLATAVRGVFGPWAWVADRRVSGLAFYRQGMGTDDVAGNLAWLAVSLAATAVPVASACLAATRRGRLAGLGLAVVAMAVLAYEWPWALAAARPWPVLVAAVLAVSVERVRRGPVEDRPAWASRATLATLALVLLAKMALAARVSQYGFTLAMPAAVVLTDAAVRWGPAWLGSRGLDRRWPRVVAVTFVTLLVFIHVGMTLTLVGRQRVRVGGGHDAFWADDRGREVNAAVAAVASADTVAVMPQGLMVNYLARRVNPIPVVNLMPPEVASFGEAAVVAELQRHPPAAIVLTTSATDDGGFVLTEGHYVYGRSILGWVRANYTVDVPARGPLGLVVLRRNPGLGGTSDAGLAGAASRPKR